MPYGAPPRWSKSQNIVLFRGNGRFVAKIRYFRHFGQNTLFRQNLTKLGILVNFKGYRSVPVLISEASDVILDACEWLKTCHFGQLTITET